MIDRTSLVFGVVFVLAGVAFTLEAFGVWVVSLADLLPVLLIAAGLALAAGSLRHGRT